MAMTESRIPEWTVGDRLRKARDLAGLSQGEMADKLGVKRTSLSAWERGENQPRNFLDIVNRWGEITGVDPGWILGFAPTTRRKLPRPRTVVETRELAGAAA